MSTGSAAQLVSAQALAEITADDAWRIFDCRHNLAEPDWGEAQYRLGHIPGAQFAHLDRDLSGLKNGRNGRHPLPDPDRFLSWLGAHGVAPEHRVLAYDDAGGMIAARLWWLLRWVGHEQVGLLDGGLPAWIAEGRALSAEPPSFPPIRYDARKGSELLGGDLLVDAKAVEANLAAPRFHLLDARAANRYAGIEEKIDPKAGHIPGAANRNFQLNLDAQGRFKPAAELRVEFEQLLTDRNAGALVHYCGSGVSACHSIFAMELAGLTGSRLYAGSWSEWCSDPARPVAVGETP